MQFERMEPTTGHALSESQREIFKLLGIDEAASGPEITKAYLDMVSLYKDNKESPAFLRIKDAYDRLQGVREDLPKAA